MGDTSIRVSDATKHRLDLEKREGESYDDVIRRLAESNRWAGFGVLADDGRDTHTGMQRIREEIRSGMQIGPSTEDEDSEDA